MGYCGPGTIQVASPHVLQKCQLRCGRLRYHPSGMPISSSTTRQLTRSQSSLDKAKAWVKELQRQANENIIIALAGNKADLAAEHPDKRAITTSDAEAYAREAGLLFFETSAKTAENVRDLFTAIARKLPLEQIGARNLRSNPRQGVDLRPEAPGTQGAGACNC